MPELVEYYTNIDKRMAWEHEIFASIEEVKTFPMDTCMTYYKTVADAKKAPDMLLLNHRIDLSGDRIYLSSCSCSHESFKPIKGVSRIESKTMSYYFEPTSDLKSVKVVFIALTEIKDVVEKLTKAQSLLKRLLVAD